MKQMYERIVLTVTKFDCEDVITTSAMDKNNAYQDLSEMLTNDNAGRSAPLPGSWF